MTFIEDFERELARLIEDTGTLTSEIVRWASEKVLESYRNGITAGQNGAAVKRAGASRRRGALGKPADLRTISAQHSELTRRGIAEAQGRSSAKQE